MPYHFDERPHKMSLSNSALCKWLENRKRLPVLEEIDIKPELRLLCLESKKNYVVIFKIGPKGGQEERVGEWEPPCMFCLAAIRNIGNTIKLQVDAEVGIENGAFQKCVTELPWELPHAVFYKLLPADGAVLVCIPLEQAKGRIFRLFAMLARTSMERYGPKGWLVPRTEKQRAKREAERAARVKSRLALMSSTAVSSVYTKPLDGDNKQAGPPAQHDRKKNGSKDVASASASSLPPPATPSPVSPPTAGGVATASPTTPQAVATPSPSSTKGEENQEFDAFCTTDENSNQHSLGKYGKNIANMGIHLQLKLVMVPQDGKNMDKLQGLTRLADGRYVVCSMTANAICIFSPTGKLVKSLTGLKVSHPSNILQLPSGEVALKDDYGIFVFSLPLWKVKSSITLNERGSHNEAPYAT